MAPPILSCASEFLWISVLLLILTSNCLGDGVQNSATLDFNKHEIVQPIVYYGRTKREIISTREKNGEHHSEIEMMLPVDAEQYLLQLHLNNDLVSENHTLLYQKNGKSVQYQPKNDELEMCHFTGSVRGKPNSWVALSTCHGIRGIIFDGQTTRYIEPVQGSNDKSLHYLFNHKNLNTTYKLGQYDSLTNNASYDFGLFNRFHARRENKSRDIRYKREANDQQIRSPYNANLFSRYVEFVLVVDHREFEANDRDLQKVHSKVIETANIVNSLFSPLNVYIALVGVVVWNERDEIELSENGQLTLTNFLRYRQQNLTFEIPNDNAHLLTRQIFNGAVIGKSLKGPMCTHEFSGGVSVIHSTVIGVIGTTIAHGLGHNFGMDHDTEDCECPDERCIMSSTVSSVVPVHWSSCSVSYLKDAFEQGMDYCLRNKPKNLFNSPTCGNGFIEPGEQCDCGLTDPGGINPCHACCNPDTCTLRDNATCGAGACCDIATCRLKSAGVVCRAADRECDLSEHCTGHSGFCPSDVYRMDSTPCGEGDNEAYCVRGECRSHQSQCRLLWGPTGVNSPSKCYNFNSKGTKFGNCGYNARNEKFVRCSEADAMCGRLQCRHLNDRLMFGMEAVASLTSMFIPINGSIIPCRSATIDLGVNDVDPGLVPDGAKCGNGRMCLKQKCVDVEKVREMVRNRGSSVCPSDCSGHGVCNSEGHCHCEQGYAPPLCTTPGPGGSVDSGPVTDLVRLSEIDTKCVE